MQRIQEHYDQRAKGYKKSHRIFTVCGERRDDTTVTQIPDWKTGKTKKKIRWRASWEFLGMRYAYRWKYHHRLRRYAFRKAVAHEVPVALGDAAAGSAGINDAMNAEAEAENASDSLSDG